MRWWRRGNRPGTVRTGGSDELDYLLGFARSKTGVEAYVEPATNVTAMTVCLIAHDGEWTRRRVAGPRAARELGERAGIPVYDVAATGYPPRMREWTRQHGQHRSA